MKEKYLSEHYQQISFKYFVKSFLIIKLLPKVLKIQTTVPFTNCGVMENTSSR